MLLSGDTVMVSLNFKFHGPKLNGNQRFPVCPLVESIGVRLLRREPVESLPSPYSPGEDQMSLIF